MGHSSRSADRVLSAAKRQRIELSTGIRFDARFGTVLLPQYWVIESPRVGSSP